MYPCFGSIPQSSPSGSKASGEAGAQEHPHAASYRWTRQHLVALCPGIPSIGLWHTGVKEECAWSYRLPQARPAKGMNAMLCHLRASAGAVLGGTGPSMVTTLSLATASSQHGLHLQLLEENFKITVLQVIFKGPFQIQGFFVWFIHSSVFSKTRRPNWISWLKFKGWWKAELCKWVFWGCCCLQHFFLSYCFSFPQMPNRTISVPVFHCYWHTTMKYWNL